MNRTYIKKEHKQQKWFMIDAKDQKLGRISTKIASTLKQKYSIYYTPYQIYESYIIIINSAKIQVSGQKKHQKIYYKHSGKPGGLKQENFTQLQKRIPNRIIEKAVKGMLPKNALGRKLFTNLKIYPGSEHPHEAQKPILLPIN